MNKETLEMLTRLQQAGISLDDALALRRIAMTLHRWFELECGNDADHGNMYVSYCITRGHKRNGHAFEYDDDGRPFMERHVTHRREGKTTTYYDPLPDRETGARKRLAKILAKYPGFQAYVQTDPRGAPLYILPPRVLRDGQEASNAYTSGVAVFR